MFSRSRREGGGLSPAGGLARAKAGRRSHISLTSQAAVRLPPIKTAPPDILQQWDRAPRQKRMHLLANFVRRHAHSTADTLDADLNGRGSLFLTRVSAAMRLGYLDGGGGGGSDGTNGTLGGSRGPRRRRKGALRGDGRGGTSHAVHDASLAAADGLHASGTGGDGGLSSIVAASLAAVAVFVGAGGGGYAEEFAASGGVAAVIEILTLASSEERAGPSAGGRRGNEGDEPDRSVLAPSSPPSARSPRPGSTSSRPAAGPVSLSVPDAGPPRSGRRPSADSSISHAKGGAPSAVSRVGSVSASVASRANRQASVVSARSAASSSKNRDTDRASEATAQQQQQQLEQQQQFGRSVNSHDDQGSSVLQTKRRDDELRQCLRVLTLLCDSGRKYKQLIVRYGGVRAVLGVIAACTDPEILVAAKAVITSLGRMQPSKAQRRRREGASNPGASGYSMGGVFGARAGDGTLALPDIGADDHGPRAQVHAGLLALLGRYQNPYAQQTAAQVLRTLHPRAPLVPDDLPAVFRMHESPVAEVQYEGDETLTLMARSGSDESTAAVIVAELVPLLSPAYTVDVESIEAMNAAARGTGALFGDTFDRLSRSRVVPTPFLRQAAAARLLERLVRGSFDLAMLAVNEGAVIGLVNALANNNYHEAQECGGRCLLAIVRLLPPVEDGVRKHMGADMFAAFQDHPDSFFRGFTAAELDVLRFGADDTDRGEVERRMAEGDFDRERAILEEEAAAAGERIDEEEDARLGQLEHEKGELDKLARELDTAAASAAGSGPSAAKGPGESAVVAKDAGPMDAPVAVPASAGPKGPGDKQEGDGEEDIEGQERGSGEGGDQAARGTSGEEQGQEQQQGQEPVRDQVRDEQEHEREQGQEGEGRGKHGGEEGMDGIGAGSPARPANDGGGNNADEIGKRVGDKDVRGGGGAEAALPPAAGGPADGADENGAAAAAAEGAADDIYVPFDHALDGGGAQMAAPFAQATARHKVITDEAGAGEEVRFLERSALRGDLDPEEAGDGAREDAADADDPHFAALGLNDDAAGDAIVIDATRRPLTDDEGDLDQAAGDAGIEQNHVAEAAGSGDATPGVAFAHGELSTSQKDEGESDSKRNPAVDRALKFAAAGGAPDPSRWGKNNK